MDRKCALKVRIERSAAFIRMDMGWYTLVVHYTFRLDNVLVFSTCFVIQELEFHKNITVLEMLHDGVVG